MRVATQAITGPMAIGARAAARTLPLPDSGIYIRSIHASEDGEWDFDLDLKRNAAFTIRPGWISAVLAGHKRVREGLDIDTPVLSMMSSRSDFSRGWREDHLEVDTVLDVKNLAKRSVLLGRHVTVLRFEGGLHDLVLSRAEVRDEVFHAIETWRRAWL